MLHLEYGLHVLNKFKQPHISKYHIQYYILLLPQIPVHVCFFPLPCTVLSPEELVEEQFLRVSNIVKTLASQEGYSVVDVGRDGNCLFASVESVLSHIGMQYSHTQLRRQLVTFLRNNPHTPGNDHLRNFISARVANPNRYFADTEQPSMEDC